MVIARLSLILSCLLGACVTLPMDSRTGRNSVVRITDTEVSPRDVAVLPGDEIIIVNRRARPVWVYLGRDQHNELLCRRGFTYYWANEQMAKIMPNESASLCFAHSGVYDYSVQTEPTVQGGGRVGEVHIEDAIPAAIVVGEIPDEKTAGPNPEPAHVSTERPVETQ